MHRGPGGIDYAILRNPLDVLAQQIVAIVAQPQRWPAYRPLSRTQQPPAFAWRVSACSRRGSLRRTYALRPSTGVLDMLAGRYPSDEFAELRPRITWDRIADTLSARARRASRLAMTQRRHHSRSRTLRRLSLRSAPASRSRVGELDEEMVFESRTGDTFVLGASTWRIEEITHDRVLVSPAPGQPGKMPFWHGDDAGRPLEFGRAHRPDWCGNCETCRPQPR